MKIQALKINDLIASIPIIQGGMGIGVSGSSLAAAVANEGGIGIISGVQIGYKEPDFLTNTVEANMRALRKEIQRARELSPHGIIGVNFMVAMKNYKEMVKVAVEEKIDLIVSGAGLPLDLPTYVENSKTKLLPIVSSAKAANIIIKRWLRQGKVPDAIVVEGPLAGGHLGFKKENLQKNEYSLEQLLVDVLSLLEKLNKSIPVIAAGGIATGRDIAKFLNLGASGVQIGSLFVTTEECDASLAFKQAYVNAKEEDIQIIKSPVGLPGRALHNSFVERIEKENLPVKKCFRCLETCNPADTPYCISQALIDAVETGEGLIFTGGKAYLNQKISTVKEVMNRLTKEISEYE